MNYELGKLKRFQVSLIQQPIETSISALVIPLVMLFFFFPFLRDITIALCIAKDTQYDAKNAIE